MANKPNFFIVGTPKAGTTSLFNYLEEHPQVFLPKIKEPHYFSTPEVKETYYKTKIIDSLKTYLNLFKGVNNEKAVGDLSTSYLFNSKSAKRIHEFNLESKIIIVLRNPVERAISHYLMDRNLGYIDVEFNEFLENLKEYEDRNHQYIKLGYYYDQVSNYLKVFNESNVLIVLSEEFFENPEKTLENIFNFINVDSDFKPNFDVKYNQYSEPKYNFVKQIKQSYIVNRVMNNFPEKVKENLKEFLLKKDSKKPSLETERLHLKQLYEEDIIKTSKLINKDLNAWL